MWEFLILFIALLIGAMVVLFVINSISEGLTGGAGIVSGISGCCGGKLFLGIVVIIVTAAIAGFLAGKIQI
jgi:hypothetical protein